MNFTSHKVWGGVNLPHKLKCLVAPPKGAQLFAIEFLWCIDSFTVWINNFFLVFITFLKIIWVYVLFFGPNFDEKKKKNYLFGHKITNMYQISLLLYCIFSCIYIQFFTFWFLVIWAFWGILGLFLAQICPKFWKFGKLEKWPKIRTNWSITIFFIIEKC